MAVSNAERLVSWQPGMWRIPFPRGRAVLAGVTDRAGAEADVRAQLPWAKTLVWAQQVHGASIAAVETAQPPVNPIPGCDALTTDLPGVILAVRSADCLPILAWDPVRRVVGLAHAGWRGLAAHLPSRLVTLMRQRYQSAPRDLWVAVGPSIRACCYEVGEEFLPHFGAFLRQADGRRMCDLIGCAWQQVAEAGVPAGQVLDTGVCTACDGTRWHSVRRDGRTAGRGVSFLVIRP